jgi:hypothetical protein
MSDLQTLTTFLGWCSVINMGLLLFSTAALMLMKNFVARMHSKLLGVDRSELPAMYFQYLGNYKVIIIVFNIVPYVALKLMAQKSLL